MRHTSAAQITSGECEGGSLQITLSFEGRIVDMLKLLLPTATSSPALPGQLSLSINIPRVQAKAAPFSHRNQDTDGVLK